MLSADGYGICKRRGPSETCGPVAEPTNLLTTCQAFSYRQLFITSDVTNLYRNVPRQNSQQSNFSRSTGSSPQGHKPCHVFEHSPSFHLSILAKKLAVFASIGEKPFIYNKIAHKKRRPDGRPFHALNLLSLPDNRRLIFSWCRIITIKDIMTVTMVSVLLPPRKYTTSGMAAAAEIDPSDT